jgi:hypothetical protein
MRPAVLAALVLSLNLAFVVGEAAAQTCQEDDHVSRA